MSGRAVDVEEALAQLRWAVPPEVDARVLRDGREALAAAAVPTEARPRARSRHRWWPRIGVAGMLSAAAAAVVYFAFLAPPSLTLAQVTEALAEQTWIHIKYDNGRERWIDLAQRRFATRWEDYDPDEGRLVFQDYTAGVIHDHRPGSGYISERPLGTYEPAQDPWGYVVGSYEKIASAEEEWANFDVEKHTDELDGRDLVRFDIYYTDPLGTRILKQQIWADPRTRLPVRHRERLQLARREEQGREYITGDYDFPETGPASIYDLGAPEGLPIHRPEEGVKHPDVAWALEESRKAQSRFPQRYRAVVWQNSTERGSEIDIIYRDGERMRTERYFSSVREGDPHYLRFPATAGEVLAWAEGQVPVSLGVFDGEVRYSKDGPFPGTFEDQDPPTVRVRRASQSLLNTGSTPHHFLWPHVRGGSPEALPPALPGCVGMRWEAGNWRQDYYVDPDFDFICVSEISWRKRGDIWQKEREYWLGGRARLPGWHGYSRQRHQVAYGDPDRGIGRGVWDWLVDVQVLEADEFPPDTFNGEKLLEGAVVESD